MGERGPSRPAKDSGPSVIDQLIQRTATIQQRYGRRFWHPEAIALDPVGDPGRTYPRLTPPTPESPRLFISYAWDRDEKMFDTYEEDLLVDDFASFLFNRGYDIVYDRDPRNFGKKLKWTDMLMRMIDCNYFVPIITKAYLERISSPKVEGALVAEWSHARQLFPKMLTFIGIWQSRSALPEPLTLANTVDVRQEQDTVSWSPQGESIRQMFPDPIPGRRGVPNLPAPVRPPDPPHWPKYQPY